MITDILVNVPATSEPDPATSYGLSVAKKFGASVTGVSFALEAIVPPSYFGAVPVDYIVESRAVAEEAATGATAAFAKAASGENVNAETRVATASVDGAADAFGRLSRLFDLSVVTQPNPDKPGPESILIEAALFESGRAVLIVPYIQKKPMELNRVMVAWDGGRAATRALSEARPILEKAKQIEILVVETGKPDESQIPGADLARHLARHKLKVELRRVLAPSKGQIDETILNEITDSGIDLVVMGGYGHSRIREFVLGGVTRGILESMTAPVLMAH